ncbi:predicted protein [Histoplasma capsulatum G186AR]|uniref:Uncharacterized protein n=1 Tax=Ajellomyces capsulatus (strain G186AR / H82 / ATCC MYA-2454 / RMSCC 2432) TaxID=447093 RepID=C0NBV9_AJECG|nr:uncharacterized protein HCBG_00605 [Histoplasma capsulatum G186AR]EEH11150.1 predicted protein [Histoplasma capsulatum G186AR]
MHLFNLLATITITFLGVQTAIAVSNPMEQTEQTPQIELDNQAKQELQELLKQDFQGERCVRACYSQKPICNGAGAFVPPTTIKAHFSLDVSEAAKVQRY